MDDSEEDQRLPHHREPKEFIPLDKLSGLCMRYSNPEPIYHHDILTNVECYRLGHPELGILSWRLNADDWENDENLKKIRGARGYSYMV